MYSIYGPYEPDLEGFINYAYVTANELNVRYSPINGAVIESLSYGTKVKVQSMRMIDGKAWVYIAYNISEVGMVEVGYLLII